MCEGSEHQKVTCLPIWHSKTEQLHGYVNVHDRTAPSHEAAAAGDITRTCTGGAWPVTLQGRAQVGLLTVQNWHTARSDINQLPVELACKSVPLSIRLCHEQHVEWEACQFCESDLTWSSSVRLP